LSLRPALTVAIPLLGAACGGAAGPQPSAPVWPTVYPSISPSEEHRSAASADADAGDVASRPNGGAAVAPAAGAAPAAESTSPRAQSARPGAGLAGPRVEMRPPLSTALGDKLQSLRLDPQNLPPIEKLEPKTLRRVMTLMAESLGVKCEQCHEESDFAAPTRRKKIAMRMWDEFVAKLTMADGSPLFCDSCHQGRLVQLDRSDGPALSAWMDANFVAKLARKDGQPQTCETCHVDMNMRFLSDWGR
jgi:hypothetical protein